LIRERAVSHTVKQIWGREASPANGGRICGASRGLQARRNKAGRCSANVRWRQGLLGGRLQGCLTALLLLLATLLQYLRATRDNQFLLASIHAELSIHTNMRSE
jgi:hypothetical protein